MATLADALDQQFKDLTKAAREHIRAARESDLPLPPASTADIAAWVTRCGQIIGTLSPNTSEYYQQYARALRTRNFYRVHRGNYRHLCLIEGAVTALHDDFRKGLLRNLTGALQTEIFADFLESAQGMIERGRAEPAAVLVGAVLESALLKVAAVMNVASRDEAGSALPPAQLNDALHREGIYDKLTQGQVRGFLALRDAAVAGQPPSVAPEQARLMLQFTQNFCASQLA